MNRRYVQSNGLVFDLGMNNGDDTAYYLKKGFHVVAVEANPALADQARTRFEAQLKTGQLRIYQLAIWSEYARLPFHISKKNAHWSSLDAGWASRENGETETIQVDCVPLAHLFALHGVPFFLKIDVEGADEMVIDQLGAMSYLPAYASVEDCRFGFRYLDKLSALGYTGFKLSNQASVSELVDEEIGHHFTFGSSGPLGDQVGGPWYGSAEIRNLYEDKVRTRENERRSPPGVWWDIHTRGPQSLCI